MEKTLNRAVILGCACVVTSALTVEQIENFQHFMPEGLALEDENSGKVCFTMEIDKGPGSLTSTKAVYSRVSTPDGRATITILLDPDAEDKYTVVRDKLGPALLMLELMEKEMLERLDELDEHMRDAEALITRL